MGGDDVCRCTHLDQVLALWLGDQRLELGRGEGVDQSRLGDNQEQDLSTGQNGQLIGLVG